MVIVVTVACISWCRMSSATGAGRADVLPGGLRDQAGGRPLPGVSQERRHYPLLCGRCAR